MPVATKIMFCDVPGVPKMSSSVGSVAVKTMAAFVANGVPRFRGNRTPKFLPVMASLQLASPGIYAKFTMLLTPVVASIMTTFLPEFDIFLVTCCSSHSVAGNYKHADK
jgi:hypothetical protein